MTAIRVENLRKNFGKAEALKGISFSLSPGSIYGFVGPNGAGKTTAIRILATIDVPTGGDALVNGISAVHYPEKVRPMVGFVPDTLPVHQDITVHEYIDFFARAYGLSGNTRITRVKGVEIFTGIEKILEKTLKGLSKGMRQRVSLARALVHDPDILLMDEPAAGLDPRARIELRELMKELALKGKAILVSSHILSELTEVCDGAVIIEQGRILRTGSIGELTSPDMRHTRLVIRPLDKKAELIRDLMEKPEIIEVRESGREILAKIKGGDEAGCDLLSGLIAEGYRIAEFRRRQTDLEDVFMQITNGEVQ